MRIRFTGTVCLDPARVHGEPGGQYNPGDEVDVSEWLGNQLVGGGFARRVPPVEVPHPPRAVEAPPVDRMARKGDAHRKSTTYREG